MKSVVAGKNILVVDDEAAGAEIFADVAELRGYAARICMTGEDAWRAVQETVFSFLLIDWKLPDMVGLELIRRIRQLPAYDGSVIIVVTGQAGQEVLEDALEAGADDYLIKPVPLSLLQARLNIAEVHLKQKRARLQAEQELQLSQSQLEQRVRQRTAELELANRALQQQIGHRQRAEQASRESAERLRLAMDAANDGLWDWQVPEDRVYASPRWFTMLGYVPDAFPVRLDVMRELIHEEDLSRFNEALAAHLQSRQDFFEVNIRLRTAHEDWCWILSRGKIIERTVTGEPVRFIGTHVNVTEQIRLRKQLDHALRLESLATLAAGIAHEINQPLSALQLTAGLLEMATEQGRPFSDDQLLEKYRWIQGRAEQISEIIRHMRRLVRKDGDGRVQPTLTHEVVERALALLQERLRAHAIRVELTLDESVPAVRAQPIQLEQILVNILVNALHALEHTGVSQPVIRLSSECREKRVCLRVRDNGPGLGDDAEKIFDPFFTTDVGGGMGLGLSLAHTFVTSWGGTIRGETLPEGGAEFTLELAAVEEELPCES